MTLLTSSDKLKVHAPHFNWTKYSVNVNEVTRDKAAAKQEDICSLFWIFTVSVQCTGCCFLVCTDVNQADKTRSVVCSN